MSPALYVGSDDSARVPMPSNMSKADIAVDAEDETMPGVRFTILLGVEEVCSLS